MNKSFRNCQISVNRDAVETVHSENYCFSKTVTNVRSSQVPRHQRVQLLNFPHVVSLLVVATLHLNGFLTSSPIHVSRAVVPWFLFNLRSHPLVDLIHTSL